MTYETHTTVVTADILPSALMHCFSKDIVPFVTSAPGVGKSMIVEAVAEEIAKVKGLSFYRFSGNSNHSRKSMEAGFGFIDLRVNMMTQVDLYGLPTFTNDKEAYKFARPDMLPAFGQGILFIDELPQAAPSVMGALSELLLNHRIGRHVIPRGWKIAAAGNRLKDRAAVNRVPSHIKDRMNYLPLVFSLEPFITWCTKERIHPAVIGFVKYRPSIVDGFDAALDINCTPRSIVQAAKHMNAPDSIRYPLLAGAIGDGPAAELEGFLKVYQDLPDFDYILEHPDKAPVSNKLDVLYAITTSLALRTTASNINLILPYIKRISKPEFRVAYIKQALLNDDRIISTDAFEWFLEQHKNLLVG